MGSKENIYKSKKNKKWIELFEKFDPEGAGRISTEDFLLALDSAQWPKNDPQCWAARAPLKCKVLEYGTSFITLEEFVQLMNEKPKLSQRAIDCCESAVNVTMPTAYQDYFRQFAGGEAGYYHGASASHHYRPHQYHEDIISRHRAILAAKQSLIVPTASSLPAEDLEQGILLPPPPPPLPHLHPTEVHISPSTYTLPSTSHTGTSVETPSTSFGRPEPERAATTATVTSGGGSGSRHSLEHLLQGGHHQGGHQLCPHHAVHFASAYDVRRTSSSAYSDHYSSGESSYEAAYRVHTKTSSPPPLFGKLVGTVAKHFLSDERDRKYYADMYSCMPPPVFILTITLVELIFFSYYAIANQTGPVTTNGPIPIDSLFIYRPDRKVEIWRFFLYMVLHAGWLHLLFNLLVQLLVGLPLEMVHGSTRIGVVYMSGVLAGSLATSVFDSEVYLVGASGGVYALLAAHLANVLLNYNQIELGFVRLVGVFVVVSVDVGIAIYNRYAASAMALDGGSVSYVAHLAGAAAGLTIGLLVLKNFEQRLHEQLVWWVALGVYVACILFALVFNVFY